MAFEFFLTCKVSKCFQSCTLFQYLVPSFWNPPNLERSLIHECTAVITGQFRLKTTTHLKHRAGYHTNRSIWAQQIAGFGCEQPSQIPSLISKRPHTARSTHHPPPTLYHAAHQAEARRLDLYLFLCMFEKEMSINETISVPRPFSDATRSLHSSISRMNGRIGAGWNKKENPSQIIIHGEGIFLSGLLYRSLSQHVTLSICSDKCQSKGLSPGFWANAEGFQRQ